MRQSMVLSITLLRIITNHFIFELEKKGIECLQTTTTTTTSKKMMMIITDLMTRFRLITTTIWMLTTTTIYQQDNMIQIFFHLHLADDNDNDSGIIYIKKVTFR
ncbi:hypothetical protein DERP_007158 [Dermatophagoides pteronyssinus]|uniref:Uncharacterized protein n=1 Tax=Dermatophagoides pteronyssinus TaxID=6956 RepID=A0ABQ8JUB4_DERPT|nr:hypothetical protein DERP_007158 [Dermatophagoides pteronyssinus]